MICIRSKDDPKDIRGVGNVIGEDLREPAEDEEVVPYVPDAVQGIVYNAQGELIQGGYLRDPALKAGEQYEEFKGRLPVRLDYFKRTGKDQLTEKTQVEKDAIDAAKAQA